MAKILMISGDRSLAQGKKGPFYNTLEEFRKYWERIDIICPRSFCEGSCTGRPCAKFHRAVLCKPSNPFPNVFVHPSPLYLIRQPLWIAKKGIELYRKYNFNLITVHEYPPFYNGIGAKMLWKKIKVPYILEIHHIPGYPKAADMKEKIYKKISKLFLKFDAEDSLAVRVVNKTQVPEFLEKSGVPKEKIVYIPSFYIDLEIFRPMELEKRYDLIFIGRLEKNKGIGLLLKALEILNNKNFNIDLLIVGEGSLRKNYELQVKNYGLKNYVTFYGWAEDSKEIAKLINRSKALIISSFNEGGPRVLLEAMACGVPIISTKVGIAEDIIENNKNGLLIDWDPTDMAEKIHYLLKRPNLQKTFSANGLMIAEKFEKKSAIRNYADKLKGLLLQS